MMTSKRDTGMSENPFQPPQSAPIGHRWWLRPKVAILVAVCLYGVSLAVTHGAEAVYGAANARELRSHAPFGVYVAIWAIDGILVLASILCIVASPILILLGRRNDTSDASHDRP